MDSVGGIGISLVEDGMAVTARGAIFRPAMLALLAAVVACELAHAAPQPAALTEPAVRDFMTRQEAAWNARDARAYFAFFTPGAAFVEEARTNTGGVVRYGSSTLAQARRQAARFFAGARSVDRTVVTRIEIAPDGRSARVFGRKVTATAGGARSRCAETAQTLTATSGRILSQGETSTAIRCRDAGR
jgi:hypothetical protein